MPRRAAADAAASAASIADNHFETRSEAMASTVNGSVDTIWTAGYGAGGDGGGAVYRRVVGEPAHAGKLQSADGAWWELAEREPNAKMFGGGRESVLTPRLPFRHSSITPAVRCTRPSWQATITSPAPCC